MHDVTEGGILGAVWEMCEIAGVGAEICFEDIPVTEVTKKISEHFGIDWLRLISSGLHDDRRASRTKRRAH